MKKLIRTQSKDLLISTSSIDYIRIVKEYDELFDKSFYEIEASVNEREIVTLGSFTTEKYAQIELIRILTTKVDMYSVSTEEELEKLLKCETTLDDKNFGNIKKSQYILKVVSMNE